MIDRTSLVGRLYSTKSRAEHTQNILNGSNRVYVRHVMKTSQLPQTLWSQAHDGCLLDCRRPFYSLCCTVAHAELAQISLRYRVSALSCLI
jgi:hypothetical protein